MGEQTVFLAENKPRILEIYAKRKEKSSYIREQLEKVLENCSDNVALAMKYLYGAMPLSDMINYHAEAFLDFAVHGVRLWEEKEVVRAIPEDIFLNYVLFHRVNDEEVIPCRSFFYDKIKDRVKGLCGKEEILELNYWCAEEVTYHAGDERTLPAMTVYNRGYGRCGEESVFMVNVLRSAGIPARQVYVPSWSHCDDNHAWVEVWCDGTWYFTGACEPLPILNQGWFTNASSRAMMVHSRIFDAKVPEEEVIGKEGMVTMLNELKRYAAAKEITVCVQDSSCAPIKDACVYFEVINYSEYVPIAEGITDEQGQHRLSTGLGSLHIFVKKEGGADGGILGEGWIDVRNEDTCTIVLREDFLEMEEKAEEWAVRDMIAPVDRPVNKDMPAKEQTEKGNRRLKEAADKLWYKRENWENTERTNFLQREKDTVKWRKALVEVLSEKDQTDCRAEVLEEHLEYGLKLAEKDSLPKEIFVPYVLNPRVAHEVLTKYRKEILDTFSCQEKENLKKNPREIWRAITKRVKARPEEERDTIVTTPAACLKFGVGSRLSQEVLFVAMARTLGIPARLNPNDFSMEFMKDGVFVPVIEAVEKTCRLTLTAGEVQNWKYFQNWSIARLTGGVYTSLDLTNVTWEMGRIVLQLEEGNYRILTSNRLPNGNVFVYERKLGLKSKEEKSIELKLRHADLADMLENIHIPDFELHTREGEDVAASVLTEDGKHIFMFLEEGREPTEHILNEMLEQKEEFAIYADRIYFAVRTAESLNNSLISRVLEIFPAIRVLYDDFTHNVNMLGRRLYIDHEKLPMIFVTDGRLNGIYAASGYNVGTGEMLLRIMQDFGSGSTVLDVGYLQEHPSH